MTDQRAHRDDRADRVEQRLAIPVIVAALVSVPAVFLTMMEGTAQQVGTVLNWASLAVLTGESIVLFMLASDRARWLKEHRAVVLIALATVPAVVFAVGPVQLLRLVRFVGALRLVRVNRILKAGRILRTRAELEGPWRNAIAVGITLVAAAFVAVVLADQTSESRRLLQGVTSRFGLVPVVVAGLLLAGATFVVVRNRAGRDPDEDDVPPG
jgi:CsoR family transcriptional regulator, copper-sensing transcriptional repressor